MSDVVLNVLKLCLLALVYLFLARVVWVVLRELRAEPLTVGSGPGTAPPATAVGRDTPTVTPATSRRLAVRHADGRTEEIATTGETTIGRGGGCSVVLTDTFASQVHARITATGTTLRIEDLGSTNGTTVNGIRISGSAELRTGDTVGIGQSTLEVLA